MKKYLTLVNLGWFLTFALVAMMAQSIIGKFTGSMLGNFQFMHLENYMVATAITEVVGLGLLIYPRTSIYGAILISCLMSGAVALHLSLMGGTMVLMPILLGILAWCSHCLRTHKICLK